MDKKREYMFLFVLAFLWGSSYAFTNIAVKEISPLSLVSLRVTLATIFLYIIIKIRKITIPLDNLIWKKLFIQSVLSSIGAWTVLSWGQQYVGSAVASVLNSTAPLFVLLILFINKKYDDLNVFKIVGVIAGVLGVLMAMSEDPVSSGHLYFEGMLACLFGSFLYGLSAVYAHNFRTIDSCVTAFGTMLLASVVLIPLAFVFEDPLSIDPSRKAMMSVIVLSILCTGVAFLIYFRLIKTLGSVGVSSQAYLRAVIGVFLGVIVLNENITSETYIGIALCISGVIFINTPFKKIIDTRVSKLGKKNEF